VIVVKARIYWVTQGSSPSQKKFCLLLQSICRIENGNKKIMEQLQAITFISKTNAKVNKSSLEIAKKRKKRSLTSYNFNQMMRNIIYTISCWH
jgi:hypothetical protein